MTEALRVTLVPLDAEIVRRRLESDDFRLERVIAGDVRVLHFGPEFPGDALVLYRRFLDALDDDPIVAGSYVVVDPATGEVVGQVGTMGPPGGEDVEIGYGMNRAVHGRGAATAAVRALVTLLASTGSVTWVIARTAVANPAIGRVLEKNGFEVTGRQDSDEGELLVWAHDVRTGS
jgi:RimJ/RimL family protein N-acetyltransferase